MGAFVFTKIAKHRLYPEGTWKGSGLVSPHINTISTPYQHHKIMELHKTMSREGSNKDAENRSDDSVYNSNAARTPNCLKLVL